MKILHVVNDTLRNVASRYYSIEKKINNGLIRLGHDVFAFSDKDLVRQNSTCKVKFFAKKETNKNFLSICDNYRPEAILFSTGNIITVESLIAVQKKYPNIVMGQYNPDIVFSPKTIKRVNQKAPYLNATFLTTAGKVLRKFSTKKSVTAYIPNPMDKSIEYLRCFEHNNQKHDIFWASKITNQNNLEDKRRFLIPLAIEETKDISIDYYGINGKPLLFSSNYFDAISNAKMGLNISIIGYPAQSGCKYKNLKAKEEELYLYSSDRLSQYMGSGLLVFTTKDNSLEDLFAKDEELIFFENLDDLIEKIRFYKKNDSLRQKIAKNGWEKYYKAFNSERVAQYMLDVLFSKPNTFDYDWPTDKY